MLRSVSIAAALFVAPVISLATAPTEGAEPLRWKFEAGEEIGYLMAQETKLSMNVGQGGSVDQTISQTVDIVWKIEDVGPDGTAKIRQKIDRMRMKMAATTGQSWEIDTDSEEPPQGLAATLAPVFDALVSSDYVVTMTSRGEITDVEAPEKLVEALKSMPGALAGEDSDSYIRQMAKQSALKLPEGPLEIGETWSTSVSMKAPMFGAQKIETTYKYAGSRDVDGQAMEVFEPTISMSPEGDEAQGQVQADLKVTDSSGEVLFNRDAGRLASSNLKQKMDMQLSANGQSVNGTMDQTVKLELKKPDTETNASETSEEAEAQQ